MAARCLPSGTAPSSCRRRRRLVRSHNPRLAGTKWPRIPGAANAWPAGHWWTPGWPRIPSAAGPRTRPTSGLARNFLFFHPFPTDSAAWPPAVCRRMFRNFALVRKFRAQTCRSRRRGSGGCTAMRNSGGEDRPEGVCRTGPKAAMVRPTA